MIAFFQNKLGVDYPWKNMPRYRLPICSGAMENVPQACLVHLVLKDRRELADDNNDYIVAHECFINGLAIM